MLVLGTTIGTKSLGIVLFDKRFPLGSQCEFKVPL